MDTPTIQQQLGLPSEVRGPDGTVYKFGPANENTAGYLEGLFAVEAMREVVKLRDLYTPDEYDAEVTACRLSIGGKKYRTGEAGWKASFESARGTELFFLTLFRVGHPAMTADLMREVIEHSPEEFLVAVETQVPGFFLSAFPKGNRAALQAASAQYVAGMRKALPKSSADSSPNSTGP